MKYALNLPMQRVMMMQQCEDEFKKTIVAIDDTPDNLLLIMEILKDRYKVKTFKEPKKALEYLLSNACVDLVLLDVMMPELSGYDLLKVLRQNHSTKEIPVIFLTALSSQRDEQKGLELGACDYITKPISVPIMLSRINVHLENRAAKEFLKSKADYLEEEIKKRTKEILSIQDITILTLASLAETRDTDTGNHLKRTQRYIKILALKLREHPKFRDYLNDEEIETLFRSAPLHDIGKVGIADKILLKPAGLSDIEFEIMKTHTTLGKEAIEHAEEEAGVEAAFLKTAKEIAYCHHENYDGSGYPLGLSGDEIPISARLMALADVYDALTSRRVYKEAMSHEKARSIIVDGCGVKFDPKVVEAFLEIQEEFLLVSQKYADTDVVLQQKQNLIERML
ncbi:MAG: response regulator [Sulfurimonas sp.]|uniref:HD domain-containing phosphohydrolase n=1 Tax=Sulfurimonas sp. TaxID=2022749 RepID=UPI002630ADC2|nr:HD domain-containing phosphohydrolase [Sulfurimonas sp.]MDD2652170.1 response regulator [Sulfurimonas sp.]MDD3450547.1 response regulator [Sulfurimonas sp.]